MTGLRAQAAVHLQKGRYADAKRLYEQALADDPNDAETLLNLGAACALAKHSDLALDYYGRALKAHHPNAAVLHSNIAVALSQVHRHEDALTHCKRAWTLDRNNMPALVNMGDALVKLGRHAEAEAVLKNILDRDPSNFHAALNLFLAYWGQDKTEAAYGIITSLAMRPGAPPIVFKNLGVMQLLRFDFANGWKNYEARFAADGAPLRLPNVPIWNGGTRYPNGHLAVMAEQGLGDELLYLSMAPDVAAAYGGPVTWEMDARLLPLFAPLYPDINFAPRHTGDLKACGATHKIHAGSLGRYLRAYAYQFPKTGVLEQPGVSLMPDKRIGVSWRSVNAAHGAGKTIPLEQWQPLFARLQAQGYDLVSLQYDATPEECATAGLTHTGLDARRDIIGLADLMVSCEHILTVSNATAHLAGALGIPMTVFVSDGLGRFFYWGEGEKTHWYAKAHIVRAKGRAWADVLDTLRMSV